MGWPRTIARRLERARRILVEPAVTVAGSGGPAESDPGAGDTGPPGDGPAPATTQGTPGAGERPVPSSVGAATHVTSTSSWKPASPRWTLAIAVVITFASILVAVVAWRTSDAASLASDLDSLAVQQLARVQQERNHLEGNVAHDLRLLPTYQEELLAARRLELAAKELRSGNAALADQLELQAQGRRAVARSMRLFFLGAIPEADEEGNVAYDPDYVQRNLEAGSSVLQEVHPERTLADATAAHSRVATLVVLVIFFAGCLLVLTLGQVTGSAVRPIFVVLGLLGVAAGTVLLAGVELAGLRLPV